MRLATLALTGLVGIAVGACGSTSSAGSPDASTAMDSSSGTDTSSPADAGSDATVGDAPNGVDGALADGGSEACSHSCSLDGHAVIDCNGATVQMCGDTTACDTTTGTCVGLCQAAADHAGSVGCDFYATLMELDDATLCFAASVVNTSSVPAHLGVEYPAGTTLPVGSFAFVPSGAGPSLIYSAYDSVAGLAPGQAAVLFLSGTASSMVPCPMPAATASGAMVQGTGKGASFHITTDVPVAAYQVSPYGGGAASIPGASLLLPTSAWGTNYVAVTAAPYSAATMDKPSLNIVASKDATVVTIRPSVTVTGGGVLVDGGSGDLPAGAPYSFTLDRGQQVQVSQQTDLTGSVIQASSPIGVMAGNACMQVPIGTSYCDHGEQMLPPVRALGHQYVGVMFRPRVTGDQAIWRAVGVVDGTQLTYSSSVGGPATLSAGQSVEFDTAQPFAIASQDVAHPFMLFAYMSGSQWTQLSDKSGYGDPDFVLSVPAEQFGTQYAFYADPTFPENDLVVVRAKDASMAFDDVTLDCSGVLSGWQAEGAYEWTRVDLMSHDFQGQGGCSTGPHTMTSTGPFGVTVWGWGTPETTTFTQDVSYGYPAGMSVGAVNAVVVTP